MKHQKRFKSLSIQAKTNGSTSDDASPALKSKIRIIDPMPSGPLPLMYSFADAAKLDRANKTTFYTSVFKFQVWLCELTLANTAQLAEQSDPAKRSFQSGQAWRGFQRHFGHIADAAFPGVYADLMQFAGTADPFAHRLVEAAFPLSLEHEITHEFVGKHTFDVMVKGPAETIALIRKSVQRHCDWLDSALHFRALQEWHLMPDCFDPDPKKRELASLGINQRYFDQLPEDSQVRFLNHLADAAVEQKNSPNWSAFHQTSTTTPQPRPWPTRELDQAIVRCWPLVVRYNWSAPELLQTLTELLPAHALAQVPGAAALLAHCATHLSLRHASLSTTTVRPELPAVAIARRLAPPHSEPSPNT
jgi:hypothetical protein